MRILLQSILNPFGVRYFRRVCRGRERNAIPFAPQGWVLYYTLQVPTLLYFISLYKYLHYFTLRVPTLVYFSLQIPTLLYFTSFYRYLHRFTSHREHLRYFASHYFRLHSCRLFCVDTFTALTRTVPLNAYTRAPITIGRVYALVASRDNILARVWHRSYDIFLDDRPESITYREIVRKNPRWTLVPDPRDSNAARNPIEADAKRSEFYLAYLCRITM